MTAGLLLKLPLLSGFLIAATACQTPVLVFSGGLLSGPTITVDSFSFAGQYELLRLEVRPENPYSVILRVSMHDDQLYIDAAENRRWHDYLQDNRNVRIKLGDSIYPATAIQVDDAEITELFRRDRTVYRLVPRKLAGLRAQPRDDPL